MAESKKVMVVIVNHNNYDDTRECLASLKYLDYLDHTVTVVDNGSTDGSGKRLEEEFAGVDFIFSAENLGYAGANNLGISRALERGIELVWLLNNDTVVEKDTLSALVRTAESNPDASMLGSLVCSYHDPNKIEFGGGRRVRHRIRILSACEPDGRRRGRSQPGDSDFITGASMMVRTEAVMDIGLLEESFFLYYEDTDWCLRARSHGWRVIIVPGSRVLHKGGSTTGRDKPHLIYYVCRNSLLCCRRNYPLWLPLTTISCLRRFVLNYLARYVLGGFDRQQLRCARMGLRGMADFFRGRYGRLDDSGGQR